MCSLHLWNRSQWGTQVSERLMLPHCKLGIHAQDRNRSNSTIKPCPYLSMSVLCSWKGWTWTWAWLTFSLDSRILSRCQQGQTLHRYQNIFSKFFFPQKDSNIFFPKSSTEMSSLPPVGLELTTEDAPSLWYNWLRAEHNALKEKKHNNSRDSADAAPRQGSYNMNNLHFTNKDQCDLIHVNARQVTVQHNE